MQSSFCKAAMKPAETALMQRLEVDIHFQVQASPLCGIKHTGFSNSSSQSALSALLDFGWNGN